MWHGRHGSYPSQTEEGLGSSLSYLSVRGDYDIMPLRELSEMRDTSMLRGNRQTPRELVLSVIGDELYEHGYPASEGTAGSLILALTRKEV